MALEIWNSGSRVGVLNVNWPLDTDPLNNGDDHIRLLKTVVTNLLADLLDGSVVVESATNATNATDATNATNADNSASLGGVEAANYARTTGTYASLRAQATTKDDVGLGSVGNYGISNSISSTSSTTYASSAAVRLASLSTAGSVTKYNAVGSYCFCKYDVPAEVNPGATIAGSKLKPASVDGYTFSSVLAGTWRCMGYKSSANGAGKVTLYVRIS